MRRRMRRLSITGAASLLFFAVASCGTPEEATVDDGGSVTIHSEEYAFMPHTIEVTAGSTVTFVISNDGQLKHEFMIGRGVRVVDDVKSGFETDFFENAQPTVDPESAVAQMDEGDGYEGLVVEVASSEQASITFTVPEDAVGDWEYGCFVQDGAHYENGMHGTLHVVET